MQHGEGRILGLRRTGSAPVWAKWFERCERCESDPWTRGDGLRSPLLGSGLTWGDAVCVSCPEGGERRSEIRPPPPPPRSLLSVHRTGVWVSQT